MTTTIADPRSGTARTSASGKRRGGRLRDIPLCPISSAIWGSPGSLEGMRISDLMADRQISSALVICPDDQRVREIAAEVAFFSGTDNTVVIPGMEVLPYDTESPHAGLVSERGFALRQLMGATPSAAKRRIFLVSVPSLMRRMAGPDHWFGSSFRIARGDELDADTVRRALSPIGYAESVTVSEHGEYCIRPGGIIDVHALGGDGAVRIRLDERSRIVSMSRFDVNTQRASDPEMESIVCLPRYEVPFDEKAISRFRQRWRNRFSDHLSSELYARVTDGIMPEGAERFLSFFAEPTSVLDYLPADALVCLTEGASEAAASYWESVRARHDDLSSYGEAHLLDPEELWVPLDELAQRIKTHETAQFFDSPAPAPTMADQGGTVHGVMPGETLDDAIGALSPWIRSERRILFVMRSQTRISHMRMICRMLKVTSREVSGWSDFIASDDRVGLAVGDFDAGFDWPERGVTIITEREIFGQPIYQKREDDDSGSAPVWQDTLLDLSGIREGDPIVHIDQGVGRFIGLESMSLGGTTTDFLKIGYREELRSFVQMDDLDRVLPYGGSRDERAPLDEMNSAKWRKGLRQSQEDILQVAQALYQARRARERTRGIEFSAPDHDYERFVSRFPFQETRDQRRAVDDIIADMTRQCPMDRVVCGDVGFGKTEVAMRAAFMAVKDGYQVAVLAPTTLLAQQHAETFRRRFAEFGHSVALLARGDGEGGALRDVSAGKASIVIGTHRMLQKDVRFASLGLVIIDEEHRFGVRQKRRMEEFRGHVDMLSLTATPIPRTLSLSLQGVRDMSILSTPPALRLSIRTAFRKRTPELIKEAISREMMRGGQVFFVHNAVETINGVADEVRSLMPEARVRIAHGQMPVDELETVMGAFYRHEFDILVCTTIIETGIDIPNANTMLIDRCERFGIAQLHQLRGRVGRSQHQAYAYLITEKPESVPEPARRRLNAVVEGSRLGQGLAIASHDLEIRGAGELLGEKQSGRIRTIGFYLYMHLLTQTINALREGREISAERNLSRDADIQIGVGGMIPDAYVDHIGIRLSYYKRIASVQSVADCDTISAEMEDRFGAVPFSAERLIERARIKAAARELDIRSIHLSGKRLTIRFWSYAMTDLSALMRRVESADGSLRFSDDGDALVLIGQWGGEHERMERLRQFLATL